MLINQVQWDDLPIVSTPGLTLMGASVAHKIKPPPWRKLHHFHDLQIALCIINKSKKFGEGLRSKLKVTH